MNILYKYIIKKFLNIFFQFFFLFPFLITFLHVLNMIDFYFSPAFSAYRLALIYHLYMTPFYTYLFFPFYLCIIFALFFLFYFQYSNALLSLIHVKISFIQILTPLFFIVILVAAILFLFSEFVVPYTTRIGRDIYNRQIKNRHQISSLSHKFILIDKNKRIFFDNVSLNDHQMTNMLLKNKIQMSDGRMAEQVLFSPKCIYVKDNIWNLYDVIERTFILNDSFELLEEKKQKNHTVQLISLNQLKDHDIGYFFSNSIRDYARYIQKMKNLKKIKRKHLISYGLKILHGTMPFALTFLFLPKLFNYFRYLRKYRITFNVIHYFTTNIFIVFLYLMIATIFLVLLSLNYSVFISFLCSHGMIPLIILFNRK